MATWSELGFRGNPFVHRPLSPTDEGRRLLVGRSDSISYLRRRIADDDACLTVEGVNGVGKTSLVQAVVFDLLSDDEKNYIALSRPQALNTSDTHETFIRDLLVEIARTVISADQQGKFGRSMIDVSGGPVAELIRAIDSNAEMSTRRLSQLIADTLNALAEIGILDGVLGIIDNLEVVESHQRVRAVLEGARDDLLSLPSTRWFLLGTPGVIRGVISSPRLQGYLAEPLQVKPLEAAEASEALELRYGAFASRPDSIRPISAESFSWLYTLLGSDLRSVMGIAADFVSDVGSDELANANDSGRRDQLERWVMRAGEASHEASIGRIPQMAWTVLDRVGFLAGDGDPRIPAQLGVEDPMVLNSLIEALLERKLIVLIEDSGDPGHQLIRLSRQGNLAFHFRASNGFTDRNLPI
jgi:hypothetical protein